MDREIATWLLYRWGYWMRRSPGVHLGYPKQAVGAWLIHTGEDKSTPAYRMRPRRKANGRIEALKYMAPDPNPKQSKIAKPDSGEQWPDEILDADRIIAEMPYSYRQCLLAKYWLELTQHEAARNLGVGRWYFRRQVEKAEDRFERVLQSRQY